MIVANDICVALWSDSELTNLINLIIPLLAVLLGYWLAGLSTKGSYLGARVDEISEELDRLLNSGSLYWRDDTRGAKGSHETALEAEIQGRMHAINCLFEDIQANFKENKTTLVRTSISELRQTLTGGDFASNNGHASSAHAISRSFSVGAELRVRMQACWRERK